MCRWIEAASIVSSERLAGREAAIDRDDRAGGVA
jgi:hypothetical protein